jgi:hypothetical protein
LISIISLILITKELGIVEVSQIQIKTLTCTECNLALSLQQLDLGTVSKLGKLGTFALTRSKFALIAKCCTKTDQNWQSLHTNNHTINTETGTTEDKALASM